MYINVYLHLYKYTYLYIYIKTEFWQVKNNVILFFLKTNVVLFYN